MDYNQQQIQTIAQIRQEEFLQEAARIRQQRRTGRSEETLLNRIAKFFRPHRQDNRVEVPRSELARSVQNHVGS